MHRLQITNLCSTPVFVIIAIALFVALYKAADIKTNAHKEDAVTIHFLAHLTLVLISTALVSISVIVTKSIIAGEIAYFIALGIGMIPFGVYRRTNMGTLLSNCFPALGR